MKKILSILLSYAMLASQAFAMNLPQAASVDQFGSGQNSSAAAMTRPPGASVVVTLTAGSGNTTAAHYYRLTSMNSPSSTVQYQVPIGKKFRGTAIFFLANVADSTIIGYGTAALAAEDTVTPPTGVVYYAGSSTGATFITRPAGVGFQQVAVPFTFPSQSYPFVLAVSSSHDLAVLLVGEEVSN